MDVPQRPAASQTSEDTAQHRHAGELSSQAGVQRLFSPESVAVVGASEAGLGSMVFQNLHRDFPGRLYPVNPRRKEVHGIKAYPTVDDLPEAVDMAVILTPAVTVPDIIEHAAHRGIGGAVVLAAGFAEAGQEGKAAQQRMTDVARTHAFPVVGPNCNGFYNGQQKVAATFAIPVDMDRPKLGPVAVVSQSGGFGSYILLKAITAGLHVSWYLSTGNESDMNVARSLRYMIEQPEVGVVLTFFEAVRSPDMFVEVAARAAELGKPILAVKAGYTTEGSRAALSHTASIAGSGEVYDAICQQYGLIQASSVEQMIDFGLTLQTGRRMSGNRLGVLTQSGGSGALMADVAETVGLTVPVLPDADREYLQSLLPSFGSAANPVDTTGAFNMENFDAVYGGLATSDGVDAVLPLIWYVGERETEATKKVWAATDKPLVLATTLAAPDIAEAGIPVYTDPARAVRAIGAVAAFSESVRRHESIEKDDGADQRCCLLSHAGYDEAAVGVTAQHDVGEPSVTQDDKRRGQPMRRGAREIDGVCVESEPAGGEQEGRAVERSFRQRGKAAQLGFADRPAELLADIEQRPHERIDRSRSCGRFVQRGIERSHGV